MNESTQSMAGCTGASWVRMNPMMRLQDWETERAGSGVKPSGVLLCCVHLKGHQVIDPGFRPGEVNPFPLDRPVMAGKRTHGDLKVRIDRWGTVLHSRIANRNIHTGEGIADRLFCKGGHCRRELDQEHLSCTRDVPSIDEAGEKGGGERPIAAPNVHEPDRPVKDRQGMAALPDELLPRRLHDGDP